jgi:xanthine/uracil permease
MKPWRGFLSVTIWLTRVAGAAITVCGISFFVLAWAERSVTPVVMGVITIGIGLVVASIRDTSNGGLEYGLFRPRR